MNSRLSRAKAAKILWRRRKTRRRFSRWARMYARACAASSFADVAAHACARSKCPADGARTRRRLHVDAAHKFRYWPLADIRMNAFSVAFGVKRTCRFALHMSANDPKRTFVNLCVPKT